MRRLLVDFNDRPGINLVFVKKNIGLNADELSKVSTGDQVTVFDSEMEVSGVLKQTGDDGWQVSFDKKTIIDFKSE